MIAVACVALLLAGCRRLPKAEATARPSLTPTPRSTPLPPVPTAVPLGSQENPLHMALAAPDAEAVGQVAINAVESAMLNQAHFYLTVDLVDSDADALAALCASPGGTVAAAWMGGLAYAAAYAQGCGSAVLQVQRGTADDATTGEKARIIVNPALEDLTSVGDLGGHSFCRTRFDDPYSWMLPSLMLRAAGVTIGDLTEIVDYSSTATLLRDVASGACDAAGIASSSVKTGSGVRTLQESVTIPYSVLVIPSLLPVGQRQQLIDTLEAISTSAQAESLHQLLGEGSLAPVEDDDLTSLRSFLSRAGIDLAQAGT